MIDYLKSGSLNLQPLTEADKQLGILGRLAGVVASTVTPTRNGRSYSLDLWEKALSNPIVQELFKTKGMFGELEHPVDGRNETYPDRIAVCMPEMPKKNKDGDLVAYVDILDTPCGQIAYKLAKYGFQFGISSRGSGDLIGPNEDEVDPDTYQLNGFDLVLLPGLEKARLSFTESLNETLDKSIKSLISTADKKDRKVMREAYKQVMKKINEGVSSNSDKVRCKVSIVGPMGERSIGDVEAQNSEIAYKLAMEKAGSVGKDEILIVAPYEGELEKIGTGKNEPDNEQETDMEKNPEKEKTQLVEEPKDEETTVRESFTIEVNGEPVEFADEASANEFVNQFKADAKYIENEASEASSDTEVVNNESTGDLDIQQLESLKKINELEEQKLRLNEKLSVCNVKETKLKEALNVSKAESAKLQENLNTLKEKYSKVVKAGKSLSEKYNRLTESFEKSQEEIEDLKSKNLSVEVNLESVNNKLGKANETITKYKKYTKNIMEHYVEAKAAASGINVDTLRKNLNESYSLKDVDALCEKMIVDKVTYGKLPFAVNTGTKISRTVTKDSLTNCSDDVVSEQFEKLLDI